MRNKREQSKLRVFINELMQGKSEEEILEAESRFLEYLKLVKSIQHRINSETE